MQFIALQDWYNLDYEQFDRKLQHNLKSSHPNSYASNAQMWKIMIDLIKNCNASKNLQILRK